MIASASGGSYHGNNYVGMTKLARDLRAADKRNLFGMTAYQLADGLLTTSDTNLGTTTSFQHGWSCRVSPTPTDEGAGQLIKAWLRTHNS